MIIAFDIDGTITEYPTQLKYMMNKDSVILTGSLDEKLSEGYIEYNSKNENRISQLLKYGINSDDYGSLVRCIGRDVIEVAKLKGEYCRDNNVILIFEDTPLFTYWISKISPSTACFLTHNTINKK